MAHGPPSVCALAASTRVPGAPSTGARLDPRGSRVKSNQSPRLLLQTPQTSPKSFCQMTGRASPWASRFARAHTSAAHILRQLRIRTPRPFFRTQASRATPRRQKIATRVKRPKTLATYCHLDVRHMHQDPHAQERRRRRPANGQHEISSREISSTSQALLPSPPSSTSATSSPKPQSYMYTPWPSDAAFPRKGPPPRAA